jgi:hypothetical protein
MERRVVAQVLERRGEMGALAHWWRLEDLAERGEVLCGQRLKLQLHGDRISPRLARVEEAVRLHRREIDVGFVELLHVPEHVPGHERALELVRGRLRAHALGDPP